MEAVGSVARLALENERLSAQVRAQLEEVRASRARIVEAGDAERRRVERDLHDGAQQRLVALAMRLETARATIARGRARCSTRRPAELRAAIGEVRDLARGVHPPILTELGLAAAHRGPGRARADPASRSTSRTAASRSRSRRPRTSSSPRPSPTSRATRRHRRARDRATDDGERLVVIGRRTTDAGGADPSRGHRAARPGGPGRRGLGGRSTSTSPTGAGTTVRRRAAAGMSRRADRRPPLRVVLADDAVLLREALAAALAAAGFEVVGQAADVAGLLRPRRAPRPRCRRRRRADAADAHDGGPRGGAPAPRRSGRASAILVLSQYVETRYAVDLIRADPAGIGYLLKDRVTRIDDIADAVRRVAAGGSVIDPEVVARLLGRPRAALAARRADPARARDPGPDGRRPVERRASPRR